MGREKDKKKIILGIVIIVLIAVITIFAWKYIGTPLINFVSDATNIRDFVDEYGIYSRLIFMAMVIFQVIIAVIPGEPFEIAAGFAFGAFEGTILCILASSIASIAIFLLVKRYGMRLVRLFFKDEDIEKLAFLKDDKKRNVIFLIIYMIPGTPKDLLSYFAGLTKLKLPEWLMICTFGRIPSVITSTIGGSAIGDKNYVFAIVVFVITMLLSVLGLYIYNQICKRNQKNDD